MKLTDEILQNIERREKIYKLYDGKGLWAEVPPRGNIRWRYKYRFEGKEKRLSVGVYPETSIEVARGLRDELRKLLDDNVDPAIRRKQNKIAASMSITELTREQLVQRVLDLEGVLQYMRTLLLKSKEYIDSAGGY